MKYFITFIVMSLFIMSDNLDVKYFVLEHNYDIYKLNKKPIFINEIFDNNFTQYTGHVKVYYSSNKIIKYENYNHKNQKIFETLFDEKERIWKGIGINGFSYEYFYDQNIIISKDLKQNKMTKTLFFNNLIVSDLKYNEHKNLTEIIIYDFKNWKKRIYDKNGIFIDEIFLPKPNK